MKYIWQFAVILVISFVSEILNHIIALPIPASIYGIIILFLCLEFKIIKLSAVKDISTFLINIMPLLFVPAAVGLMTSWNIIGSSLLSYGVIIAISTVMVMVISGLVTQKIIKLKKKSEGKNNG